VSALDAERHFNDGHSGKIFGLALVRRRCVADLTTALSASSNALRDVYLPSKYAGAPLVLLDVIKTVALVEPAEGDTGDRAVWGGRGIFWELNRPCFDRLVERLVRAPAETLVRGVVASWIETLGIEPRQLLDEFGRFRTVFVLPRPHVELICAGKWTQTCFPFVQGRAAAGCGLPYAAPLRNGLAQLVQQQLSREQDALRLVSSSDEFTPEKIQEILDTMRDHIGGEAEPALLGAISWLQRRRDEAALDSLCCSRRVYSIERIVETVMGASLLRNAGDFQEVLERALAAFIRDPAIRDRMLQIVAAKHTVPSKTTLTRHRLTLHMSFCSWQAEMHDTMLATGGVTVWRTIDSSAQGGWDWVLHGSRKIHVRDLPDALDDAHEVIRGGLDDNVLRAKVARLAKHLKMTQGVPTACGSGRAGLRRKAHCLMHSEKLTSRSWPSAVRLVNSTMTWTGDLGTESGFWSFRQRLQDLMGPWIIDDVADDFKFNDDDFQDPEPVAANVEPEFDFHDDDFQHVEPVADDFVFHDTDACQDLEPPQPKPELGHAPVCEPVPGWDDFPFPDDEYMLDFTTSIFIAGMLHVISTMTEGMERFLAFWKVFVDQLRHICRLLSRRHSRERMMETCFIGVPPGVKKLFESFMHEVYEGRWGSLFAALGAVLLIEQPLRRFWNKARYKAGAGEDHGKGDPKSTNVDTADDGITSVFFWAYAHMVDVIGEAVQELQRWCESCPCHYDHPHFRGVTRHERRVRMSDALGRCSCPLAGCWAPALAAGYLKTVLETILNLCNVTVLMHPAMNVLSESQRAQIMADFATARAHIVFFLSVKLGHWSQFPWVLFGLAHWHVTEARRVAREALAMWDREQHPHWLAFVLLAPGTIGRAQVELFATGAESLDALPFLKRMAARLLFASIVERWVEALHAASKKWFQLAPHASAVHLAFYGIRAPLRELLRSTPEGFAHFCDLCDAVRNVHLAIDHVGFRRHPEVVRLRDESLGHIRHKKLHKHLVKILFHVDPSTLYGRLPDVPVDVPPAAPPPPPPPPGPPPGPSDAPVFGDDRELFSPPGTDEEGPAGPDGPGAEGDAPGPHGDHPPILAPPPLRHAAEEEIGGGGGITPVKY